MQVLGFFAFYDESTWPIVLGLSAVTGLIEFIVLPFCPESPRWLLIKQNQEEKAIAGIDLVCDCFRTFGPYSTKFKEIRWV